MDDEDFNIQDFYDQAKRAEEYFAGDVKFRHHRSSIKDLLNWMDRSGLPTEGKNISPGAKAAHAAANGDNEKEMQGRLRIVDDRKQEEFEARPVGDQPKSFEEASNAAHEEFMSAITGKDKE